MSVLRRLLRRQRTSPRSMASFASFSTTPPTSSCTQPRATGSFATSRRPLAAPSPSPPSSTTSSLFVAMAAATATATAATTFAFADFNNESDAQTKNTPLQRRWNTNDPRNVTQVKRVMTKRPYLYNDMFVQSTLDNMKNNAVIASGSSHPALANEIVQYLGVELSPMECSTFSDGEIKIQIGKNVRGKDFFVIQSLCSTGNKSLNDSIIELLLTVSAARRASARSITAVIPYFAYARQSRKGSSKARTTIAAADLAKMLSSMGVDRILTVDLHSPEIVGCFPNHVNVTNVVPTPVAAAYFGEKEEELQHPVVVSPKSGGIFRAKQFMTTLKKFKPDVELVTFVKEKFDDGSTTRRLLGNVKGKDCILIDDMMDTGTTIIRAAERLKKAGARRVYVYVCHGLFSGTSWASVSKNTAIDEVIVSNTIPANRFRNGDSGKIKHLSLAPLLAEAMTRLVDSKSTRALTRL